MRKNIQWHKNSTNLFRNRKSFVKEFDPYSYEFKNELFWMRSGSLMCCDSFKIPEIYSVDFGSGHVSMQYLDIEGDVNIYTLLTIAAEIHSLIREEKPLIKNKLFNKNDYTNYLLNYFNLRFENIIRHGVKNDCEIKKWINCEIIANSPIFFTIVHRDLYKRNVIKVPGGDIYVIDWEFANISDPAQDIAKIIYEHCIKYTETINIDLVNEIILTYHSKFRIDDNYIFAKKRIFAFLPIILVEDVSSLCVSGLQNSFDINLINSKLNQLYEKRM